MTGLQPKIEQISAHRFGGARNLITTVFEEHPGTAGVAAWHGHSRAIELEYVENSGQAAFVAVFAEIRL